MKKLLFSMTIVLVLMAGCAPGSAVDVHVPSTTFQLTTPGPNPEVDKPDSHGRLAGALQGLWHGVIAPVTAIGAFFNPAMQMYEVHNNGPEYNLGFLVGVALIFLILGVFGGRWR